MKRFERDNHVIIWADVIEGLQSIEDESIDLIFADPPYNIGKVFCGQKEKRTDEAYLTWCYQWLELCIKKLKPHGSLYVMTSTQYMPFFDIYLRNKLTILSRVIWSYDSSGVQAKKYYGSLYEPILYAVKDKNNYTFNSNEVLVEAKTGAKRKLIDYRKNPPQEYNKQKVVGNVWEFPRVRYRMDEYENHPTQKPVALLERIIKASSNIGEMVLDPFGGSFTTGYVAQTLGRHSVSIEIQEEYIKIGLRRLKIADEYKGIPLEKDTKLYKRNNGTTT